MSAAAVNLAALQRMDPNIVKIMGDSSSFSTVYERKGAEWVRKEVEGSLFIVQRSGQPWSATISVPLCNKRVYSQ
jgi:Dcp1-like decapping family